MKYLKKFNELNTSTYQDTAKALAGGHGTRAEALMDHAGGEFTFYGIGKSGELLESTARYDVARGYFIQRNYATKVSGGDQVHNTSFAGLLLYKEGEETVNAYVANREEANKLVSFLKGLNNDTINILSANGYYNEKIEKMVLDKEAQSSEVNNYL